MAGASILAVPAIAQAQNNVGKILIHGTVVASDVQADPLKGFGQSPFGHAHDFCGSGTFGPSMTLLSMSNASSSSFFEQADHSGLWFPTPIESDGTTPVPAADITCGYYLSNNGYSITQDPPWDLAILGGNPDYVGNLGSAEFYGFHCTALNGGTWQQHYLPPASEGCTNYEEEIDDSAQCWGGLLSGLGTATGPASFISADPTMCASSGGIAVPAIHFVIFVSDQAWEYVSSDFSADPNVTADGHGGETGHFDYVFDWKQDPSNGQDAMGEIIKGCLVNLPYVYGTGDQSCGEQGISGTNLHYIRNQYPPSMGNTLYGTGVEGNATVGG